MNASHRSHREVPPSGLTVLVDPGEPSIDIVFVHGFTGHPQRTWTHKRGEARCDGEPDPKRQKFRPFSGSSQSKDHSQSVYWPVDLLPVTIPRARVLTYGYDTHIRHCLGPLLNIDSVYTISWNFLVALEAERRGESSRPVLFIAHSLGGIVVKEMLRRSNGCRLVQPHLWTVFKSTTGIMFFGTPHSGADPRGFLQRIAEEVIKAMGFRVNKQMVNTLLPSSERLMELKNEFGPMAQEQKWMIHSFQEQFGVKALNNQKVVEDMSSYLNIPATEITEHIGRNHMDMCRFSGPSDVEYNKVAAALLRMTAEVTKECEKPVHLALSQEQRQTLLNSLNFSQIDARQMTIKTAHAKTCKWLLNMTEYLDWINPAKLQEHHGLLWIKGKPGTGKSTLMKYVFANARRRMRNQIIISFFFNARGEDLEKSTTGMYRSLLSQLLERVPALQHVFDSLGLATREVECVQWTIESLQELFAQAVQGLGQTSVVCLIDALDECDENQIRDMVSFFERVCELAKSKGLRFNACFSSRHYPHITIRTGLALVLEGQEGHNQDITNYINSELNIGHSKRAEDIRTDLQEKASGIFMWVVLVVEILNKEYDCGNIRKLQQRLREIPGDLHELFHDILTRGNQNKGEQNKKEMLLCMQWVLFSRQPLKPEQLYLAILSGTEPDALAEDQNDGIDLETIKKFILHSSKGLTEVTKSKAPTVQFIHESVIDFLRKDNGLRKIWSELDNNFEGVGNEEVKKCCHEYMKFAIPRLDLEKTPPAASTPAAAELRESVAQKFPLLEYTVQNILYHADVAECHGSSQKGFMQGFEFVDWIKLDNLFKKHETQRHGPDVSLLYMLAEYGHSNLININPSRLACFDEEKERYGTPFFAALATGSDKAVEAFIVALQERYNVDYLINEQKTKHHQYHGGHSFFRRGFKYNKKQGVYLYVALCGNEKIFALFLAAKSSTPDSTDQKGRTCLHHAASEGYVGIIQHLLTSGANLEARDNCGETPLLGAACKGHTAGVLALLDAGANLEARDNRGFTPLSIAAECGHKALVEVLLANGACIESRNNYGSTPLCMAARYGREGAVEVLFHNGANIENQDDQGHTPLFQALKRGHQRIIQVLLANGANIECRDKEGRTPLCFAAWYCVSWCMEVLLDYGADINSRCLNRGRTPLIWAVHRIPYSTKDNIKSDIQLLLSRGANIGARDNDGNTALSFAKEKNLLEVAELLREYHPIEQIE